MDLFFKKKPHNFSYFWPSDVGVVEYIIPQYSSLVSEKQQCRNLRSRSRRDHKWCGFRFPLWNILNAAFPETTHLSPGQSLHKNHAQHANIIRITSVAKWMNLTFDAYQCNSGTNGPPRYNFDWHTSIEKYRYRFFLKASASVFRLFP